MIRGRRWGFDGLVALAGQGAGVDARAGRWFVFRGWRSDEDYVAVNGGEGVVHGRQRAAMRVGQRHQVGVGDLPVSDDSGFRDFLAGDAVRPEFMARQGVSPGPIHLHADNGPSMASQTLALKLAGPGVTKSHRRSCVSGGNPFSESQFKTLKYRPEFPDRPASLEDARAHCQGFFHWYNHQHHHHGGIALLTPHRVRYGRATEVLDHRQRALTAAFQQHPERFVRKPPRPAPLPDAVWINPPKPRPPEPGETR
jgi:hypothetical protein